MHKKITADLRVQQARKVEFVISLKAAQQIGLTTAERAGARGQGNQMITSIRQQVALGDYHSTSSSARLAAPETAGSG